ncbi:MAG: hypothetical protein AVDCRST_MAG50-2788, partial [uncultured Acidimicrobiales bacterium]
EARGVGRSNRVVRLGGPAHHGERRRSPPLRGCRSGLGPGCRRAAHGRRLTHRRQRGPSPRRVGGVAGARAGGLQPHRRRHRHRTRRRAGRDSRSGGAPPNAGAGQWRRPRCAQLHHRAQLPL